MSAALRSDRCSGATFAEDPMNVPASNIDDLEQGGIVRFVKIPRGVAAAPSAVKVTKAP